MLTVCCVCKRVRHGSDWIEEALPDDVLPSHGYCPDCAAAARIELALLRLRTLSAGSDLPQSAVA